MRGKKTDMMVLCPAHDACQMIGHGIECIRGRKETLNKKSHCHDRQHPKNELLETAQRTESGSEGAGMPHADFEQQE